ncbi:hypothetical protein QYM36_004768, partial [Artemia franciscana]
ENNFFCQVDGHGRLFDPPSRASAWRVGFRTPPDTNDMEGFCGGYERQWLVNKGKCGICGDPFDENIKPHEAPGGIYATGTIVRTYAEGQVIPVTIQITAVHKGYYEFRLCPNVDPNRDPPQECFDQFPLEFVGGTTGGKFYVTTLPSGTYKAQLKLPSGVSCSRCIIQWNYITGNRWGICEGGKGQLGCGPQEMFRACADVSILPRGAGPALTQPLVTPLPFTPSSEAWTQPQMPVTPATPNMTLSFTTESMSGFAVTEQPIQTTVFPPFTEKVPTGPVISRFPAGPESVTVAAPSIVETAPPIDMITPIGSFGMTPVPRFEMTTGTALIETATPTDVPVTVPSTLRPAPIDILTRKPIVAFSRPEMMSNMSRPAIQLPGAPFPQATTEESIPTAQPHMPTGAPFPPGFVAPESRPGGRCFPTGVFGQVLGAVDWCKRNCRRGFCPSQFCRCQ